MIDFKSFVWGLISCAVYDFIKSLYQKRGTHYQKYSKEYVNQVKIEFYLSAAFVAFFMLLPTFKYDFLNILFEILSSFSLAFAVFAFMCIVDVLNYVQKQSDEKNSSENGQSVD